MANTTSQGKPFSWHCRKPRSLSAKRLSAASDTKDKYNIDWFCWCLPKVYTWKSRTVSVSVVTMETMRSIEAWKWWSKSPWGRPKAVQMATNLWPEQSRIMKHVCQCLESIQHIPSNWSRINEVYFRTSCKAFGTREISGERHTPELTIFFLACTLAPRINFSCFSKIRSALFHVATFCLTY